MSHLIDNAAKAVVQQHLDHVGRFGERHGAPARERRVHAADAFALHGALLRIGAPPPAGPADGALRDMAANARTPAALTVPARVMFTFIPP